MSTEGREPIFNAPGIVIALIAAFAAIHSGRQLLDQIDNYYLVLSLAFIPARYGVFGNELPGAPWADVTSFVTHAFLHGDVFHLLVNSAWLLAVGTPVARRMSGVSFLLFFAVCAIGGAAFFWLFNVGLSVPMVGASGAISGLMAAMFRLIYAVQDPYHLQPLRENSSRIPRLSLAATARSTSALIAIGVWIALNLIFGFGVGGFSSGVGIAWEAHIGGFVSGLLLFGMFDRGPAVDRPI